MKFEKCDRVLKSVAIGLSWGYLSFYEPHNTSPDIKLPLSISEALHFPLFISEISKTHILFISIEIFQYHLNHSKLVYFVQFVVFQVQ